MKTRLHAGMLSVLIACAFSAQAAGGLEPASKVENPSSQSRASQSLVSQKNQLTEKIDLNKANANDLAHSIKGIGEKRAEAIIKYRQAHGAFKTITELAYVPGLGGNFVKKNNAELEQVFKIN